MKRSMQILLVIGLLQASIAFAAEKPNIVYILVDNWGWGDISIQGGTTATPNIETLAAQGLRLTNFNVQNQCVPTRSALHTGRLPIRSGTQRAASPGQPNGMAPWEYTIAELLSDTGYATALYGKWHIGDVDGRLPNDQGYDEWYGIKGSAMEASYTSTPQFDPSVYDIPQVWTGQRGKKSKPVKTFDLEARALLDAEVVTKTASFIKKQSRANKPFFVLAALTQIHPPYLPHPDFIGRSKAGAYADIRMQLDHYVGDILSALEQAGVANDTIVILTGDNGAGEATPAWSGDGGSNGPWRGGLSTGYEGGMRTPGMIRWPGKVPAGVVSDEIVADLDWYPTLAHLIGEQDRVPVDRPIDGRDQSKFLLGASETSNREHVVLYVGDSVFSVKWRSFKVHFLTAEGTFSPIVEHTFPQVFDIRNDPGEQTELWAAEGFAHLWVRKPVVDILTTQAVSMKKFPNIKPGEAFGGYK
ncbi:MAG: arylsulfatase A-like enzyme [Limisphaerales bacterium]|jgi:arylsulfatase A-like enzyme